MRYRRQAMSSDRAKALRDECLRDLEAARGTMDYQAIHRRLLHLNRIVVEAETREADERAVRRVLPQNR